MKMFELIFPKKDERSNGKCFNRKRRWLKHGALGDIVDGSKRFQRMHHYCCAVQFQGAKEGNTDLVPRRFLKKVSVEFV